MQSILLIFGDHEKYCLSFHYNGSNSFLFVNATKRNQFKANNSEIKNILYVWKTFQKTFLDRI